jgi:hypothetical protein
VRVKQCMANREQRRTITMAQASLLCEKEHRLVSSYLCLFLLQQSASDCSLNGRIRTSCWDRAAKNEANKLYMTSFPPLEETAKSACNSWYWIRLRMIRFDRPPTSCKKSVVPIFMVSSTMRGYEKSLVMFLGVVCFVANTHAFALCYAYRLDPDAP